MSLYMQGILWMAAAAFSTSVLIATLHFLTRMLSIPQLILLHNAMALVLILALRLRADRFPLRTRRWRRYLVRSFFEVLGTMLSYHALTLLGLPAFAALSFMTPLFIGTAAVLVLGERCTWHTWFALGVGMAGALLITNPSGEDVSTKGALFSLGGSCCFTVCGILIKTLTKTEAPRTIAFYMFLLTGLSVLPLALADWKPIATEAWPWLLLLGLAFYSQQVCIPRAFSKAPLTVILPVNFLILVFSAILGWLAFDEVISFGAASGGIVILGAAIFAARRAATARV